MQDDQLLTTLDASRLLNCSPDNVRLLARQDKLPAVTTMSGRQRLFKLADVQRLARQREARAKSVKPVTERSLPKREKRRRKTSDDE